MPFTLAHPAIVLPLKYLPKKWISMTGLIAGSVMPDFESLLRMYSDKQLTHSWPGFFYFGLPLGILLTFLFHNIVRNPLIVNFPAFLRERFSPFINFNWNKRFVKDWWIVIISMIVGAASHFLWDSFSHFDSWLLRMYPQLKGNIYYGERQLEIPFLIQYINTLLGIAIIGLFILKLPRIKGNVAGRGSLAFKISFLLFATAIFFVRIKYIDRNMPDDRIIALISSMMFSLIITAFVLGKRSLRSEV